MPQRDDPASSLIATHLRARDADLAVYFNCAPDAVAHSGRTVFVHRNVAIAAAAEAAFAARGSASTQVIAGHGACGLPALTDADIVAIRIPREKVALLQLLHDAFHALREGGVCYVAGATNEGVKSAAKLLSQLFGNTEVVARGSSHRLLSAVKRARDPEDASDFDTPFLSCDVFHQVQVTLRGLDLTLFSRPGVFSWDHLDEATEILASVMDVRAGDSVLDLGCGTGGLGIVAAMINGGAPVVMVDADVEAVRSASRSVAAARIVNAQVLPSDVVSAVDGRQFDVVITNPPFHSGRATDLDLPARFIHDAFRVLKPGGRLNLVANRTLPYERDIRARFGNDTSLYSGPRFKVISAVKPNR